LRLLLRWPVFSFAKIKCVRAFEFTPRDCDAFVIRRGLGGTATVDIPGNAENRSILFVKGLPVASNASVTTPMTTERVGDITLVKIGEDQRYEIPDAMVTGG
jgi:hypothetical protein